MIFTHTRRPCPYCRRAVILGNCVIVATNVVQRPVDDTSDTSDLSGEADPYALLPGRSHEQIPVSGRPVLRHIGVHPVVAEAPLVPERPLPSWRRLLRRLPRRLPPLSAGTDLRDLPARLCPHCARPLPPDLDDGRRIYTIAVIGSPQAGKTHFLASLLLQADREQTLRFAGCTEFAPDEATGIRYQTDYFGPLFQRREILPITQAEHGGLSAPLVYRVRFAGSDPCALLFHDVAGEVLTDPSRRAEAASFVGWADAAVFLVDPVQLHRAHWRRTADGGADDAGAGEGADAAAETYSQAALLQACLNDMRRCGRLATPLAVTLSKADLLADTYPDEPATFMTEPEYSPEKWFESIHRIDGEVRTLLGRMQAHDLLAAGERLPPELVSFHAVAPIGAPADPVTGAVRTLQPTRCLDPLVTLLHRIPGLISQDSR